MPAFFRGGWTRSMVRLPDVKSKNIVGSLLIKPAENRTNPKEAKAEHLLKEIRSFSTTIEIESTRRALLQKHESMECWSLRAETETPALSDFYSLSKTKNAFLDSLS